ncbi:MAG TPA: 2-phosphosulfolactate phosphatase [Bacteroidia bacterium]|nr:2-phosphosulfolactate phosphatase [Bacteroidia bacterium]
MYNLDVVLTPAMLPLYQIEGKIVVVIDILRATSSMCVAFETGVEAILPVSTPEECATYQFKGFVCAAERDGMVVEGFDIGNSPFSYLDEKLKGKKLAITTTNGTYAIQHARHAHQLVIGSFLNLKSLCEWLITQNRDVVLLCAGWKNKFNLEDTLFAGAVAWHTHEHFATMSDAAIAAQDLYELAKVDLYKYILKSSHAHRFKALHIERDIEFCMQQSIYSSIPVLEGDYLVKMELPGRA